MQRGRLEVISGPMFSGKTGELIRRLVAADATGERVVAVKSRLDDRHGTPAHLSSHDGLRFPCTPLRSASEIPGAILDAAVVGIDEAQFLEDDLAQTCRALVARGLRVIVAGLDQDYRGIPFEPFPALRTVADEVCLLTATCAVCGSPASRTHRIVSGNERVLVGAEEAYEPRCEQCFPGAAPSLRGGRPTHMEPPRNAP